MKKFLLMTVLALGFSLPSLHADTQTLTVKGATGTLQNGTTETFGKTTISYNTTKYLTRVDFPQVDGVDPVIYLVPNKGSNTSNSPSYNKEGSLRMYPNNKLTFTAKEGQTFTKLVLTLANSSAYAAPTVSTGSGSPDKTTNPTTYTWESTKPVTSVTFTANSGSGKQFCFKSVVVTYTSTAGGGEPTITEIGDIVATCAGATFTSSETEPYEVTEGATFKFTSKDATSIEVKAGDADAKVFTGAEATWKPDVCEATMVTVTAKRDNCTDKTFTFYLTVKAKPVDPVDPTPGPGDTTDGTWIPVTSVDQLAAGDIVTFYTKEYTQTGAFAQTVPPLTMKDIETKNKTQLITAQKFNYDNVSNKLDVTTFDIVLGKSGDNWTLSYDGKYLSASTAKAVSLSETIDKDCSFEITFGTEANGFDAKVTSKSDTPCTLCYNPNVQSSTVNITTARFAFYTSTSLQKVYMYKFVPTPKPKIGKVEMSYNDHFLVNDDNAADNSYKFEEGAVLTFTAEDATEMSLSYQSSTSEEVTTLDAVAGNTLTWRPELGNFKVTVNASNDEGKSSSTYTIEMDETTFDYDVMPVWKDNKADSNVPEGQVHVTTPRGYLYIYKMPYDETTNNSGTTPSDQFSLLADEENDYHKDWIWESANTHAKLHVVDITEVTEPTQFVAKATVHHSDYNHEKSSMFTAFIVDPSKDEVIAGIKDVTLDNENAEVIFYNLQGQRTAADQPGLYIRKQGTKVEKIVIR